MAEDRAAKIARIQKIERIKALEAERSSAGAEEEDNGGAGQALLRGYDYLGLNPIIRNAVGVASGVIEPEDAAKSLTPFSGKGTPSFDEIYTRMGIPQMGSLSDVLPFEEPGPDGRWYVPDKGGMLDFTGRGTAAGIGEEANLYNVASFGGAGALKYAGRAANQLLKGTKAGKIAEKAGDAALEGIEWLARAPTKAMRKVGDVAYNYGIAPMAAKAAIKGKDAADTYYRHNIFGFGMGDQVASKKDELWARVQERLAKADAAGGKFAKREAFKPTLDELTQMVKDQRLSPEDARAIARSLFGIKMPGKSPSLTKANQWKSDLTNKLPGTSWNEVQARRNIPNTVTKKAAANIDKQVKKGMEAVSGPDEAAGFGLDNADWGILHETHNAAKKVDDAAMSNIFDAGDAVGLGAAMVHPTAAMTALTTKKILDLLQSRPLTSGLGYGLKKSADAPLFGGLLDYGARRSAFGLQKNDPEDKKKERK